MNELRFNPPEIPVGGTIMWPYATLPTDSDWLLLDGSTFNASEYPELAALNGGTTLPDWRFRFPLAAYADAPFFTPPGLVGGSATHAHTQPAHVHTQPAHAHTQPAHAHTTPAVGTSSQGGHVHNPHTSSPSGIVGLLANALTSPQNHSNDGTHSHTTVAGNTGSAGADNTGSAGADNTGSAGADNTGTTNHNPPFVTVHFIIRGR